MTTFSDRLRFPYYDYIPQHGLKNLSKYKYSSMDLSIIAQNILIPFWTWLAQFLPEWPAPNLITFAGFVPCFIAYLITAFYCPTLTEVVPQWLSFVNFICLWIYQTLDALDGKQARRTGTSSPLGELFDHGCDALTTIFVALTVGCTLQLGSTPLLYAVIMAALIPFYSTQWEEYFTGTLVLGYIGVTEGQMATLAIYLSASIFGVQIFSSHPLSFIPSLSHVPLSHVLVYTTIIIGFGHFLYNCLTVYSMWKVEKASAYNALGYLFPVSVIQISTLVWINVTPKVLTEYAHLYLLMIGLIVANFVGRIIVYRVCALDAEFFPELLVPLVISTVNSALGDILFSFKIGVYFTLIFYSIAYLHFAVSIIDQMTTYLKIRCFVIPVPNLASTPPVHPYGEQPHTATVDGSGTTSNGSAKRVPRARSPKGSPHHSKAE